MFDSRFGKSEHEYSGRELLLTHLEEARKNSSSADAQSRAENQAIARITERLEQDSSRRSEEAARLEDLLADNMADLRAVLGGGFTDLQQTFEWGFSGLYLKLDLQHRTLEQIAEAVVNPLTNQGREQRQHGEKSVLNGWYDEAVSWLSRAVETNSLDYLAHFELAHVNLFRYHNYDEAKEHFELADKYSNHRDASDTERFYSALSYAHLSLTTRLRSNGNDDLKALDYAKRGYDTCNTCIPAVVEYLYMLCHAGKDDVLSGLLTEILRREESLLPILRANSELQRCLSVQTGLEAWQAFHVECSRRINNVQNNHSFESFIASLSSSSASPAQNLSMPRQLTLRYCSEVLVKQNELAKAAEKQYNAAVGQYRDAAESLEQQKKEDGNGVVIGTVSVSVIFFMVIFSMTISVLGAAGSFLTSLAVTVIGAVALYRLYSDSWRNHLSRELEEKVKKLEANFHSTEALHLAQATTTRRATSVALDVKKDIEAFTVPGMSRIRPLSSGGKASKTST